MPESTHSAQLTLALALSPWRERPELLSRLAPLNPPPSGARDVPARSGSECNRRIEEGSGTSRLSEPLRPGTGRAPARATCRRAAPVVVRRGAGQHDRLRAVERAAPGDRWSA